MEIRTGDIFELLSLQSAMPGARSLLGMDKWSRSQVVRETLKCRRNQIASDTAMTRALSGWDMDILRPTLRMSANRMKQDGRLRFHTTSGRVFHPAVVDGSFFGGLWATALALIGDEMTCGVDLEPYRNRGCERGGTRRLMDRAVKSSKRGFASHLLADGLYADRPDFDNSLTQWGMHLLVKTEDERLGAIKWAKELFDGVKNKADLEELGILTTEGKDHRVTYQVMAVRDADWQGSPHQFNVARVIEKHHTGKDKGRTFVFWILTTDQTLLPSEMRELAHARWRIETNLFRELNELAGSKRAYIRNHAVKLSLLLIAFLSWTLFQAFRLLSQVHAYLRSIKSTKQDLQRLICFDEILISDTS